MNRFKKIMIYFFGSLVGIYLLAWLGFALYSGWKGYMWEKKTNDFQMALSKPYREDTYGGKTPEETWTLFLDALKKKDVELASKYFVPEKQVAELNFLKEEKQIDNLDLLIKQFSVAMHKDLKTSSDNVVYFLYTTKEEVTGIEYANSLVFILNPYTKVWKISVL